MRDDLRRAPHVARVDVFGAADVVVGAPGAPRRVTARLFAVEPSYFAHHRWVVPGGDVRKGALLAGALGGTPGFGNVRSITIELKGAAGPLRLQVPVAGRPPTYGPLRRGSRSRQGMSRAMSRWCRALSSSTTARLPASCRPSVAGMPVRQP